MKCPRLVPVVLLLAMSTAVVDAREQRWSLSGGGRVLLLARWVLDLGCRYGFGRAPAALLPGFGPRLQPGDNWVRVPPSARTGTAHLDTSAKVRLDDADRTLQQLAYAVLALDYAVPLAGSTMLVVGVFGNDDHKADRVSLSIAPLSNGMRLRVRY